MNDWQLLQDYAGQDSEAAFRALVEHHVGLVYSVALRQVRDAQLAEEVAQSVFILLARKAGTFGRNIVLPSWLFRTTRFVASRALRAEQRRQRREQEAFAMQQLTTADDTWKRIAPAIDEGLESLGGADRDALLLRFFNDKSHLETATALGISEDAAKKRVTRALEKLREFFARRGVSLSAAALASVVTANAAKMATPDVCAAVAAKVVGAGTMAAGILPPLVSQTLKAWRWAKLRIAGGIGIATVASVLVAYWLAAPALRSRGTDSAAATQETVDVSTNPDANRKATSEPATPTPPVPDANTLAFRAVDAQTSEGIADAKIAINYVSPSKWWAGKDQITDAKGISRIPIPEDIRRLDIGVLKNGYAQKFYTWRGDLEQPLPSTFILKVERGVSIGGSVKDEAGTAIADAKVFLKFPEVGDASFREPKAERLGFIRDLVAAKTDAEGRWTCALVPAGYDEFSLEIHHPHYSTLYAVLESDDRNYVNPVPRFKLKELLNGEANFVMRAGFRLAGIVLDDAGQPKAGAEVAASLEHGYEQGTVTTKADGAFEIGGLAAGAIHLSASADGFAPADQAIDVKASQSNLVLRLVRGTTVSIRVEDEDGNGVGGAWVAADVGERTSANWRAISEPNGVAQLSGIPESVRNSLQFHAGAQDFFIARNQRVDLSPLQPTIQLKRSLTVSGLVTDAESGEVIPWFKAIPCRGEGRARDGLGSRKFGTNGNFTVSFMEYGSTLRVRIEADGYEPAMSTPLSPRPATQSIELKLRRTDLSKAIRGVVLLPNGQPAVGADVALLTFEHGAYLNQGRIMRRGSDSILARTDGEGRFQFNADENAHSILVATDTAYGRTRIRVTSNVVAQLSAHGRIAGRVRTRDGSWANRDVMMLSTHNEAGFTVNYTTKSDSQGNFNFESVPALDYTVYLNPGTGKTLTDATAVEVRAGESTDVQIGGTGATITGRLNFGSANTLDWPGQIKRPILQPKYTPPPQAGSVRVDRRSPDRAERIKELDLVETDEWRAWSKSQRPSIVLKVAADGSFSGEDLRAGEYTLRVELTGEKSNGAVDPIAEMRRRPIASIQTSVVVSEAQEKGSESIDLGVLELQPIANR